jgi:hypothetical protein
MFRLRPCYQCGELGQFSARQIGGLPPCWLAAQASSCAHGDEGEDDAASALARMSERIGMK